MKTRNTHINLLPLSLRKVSFSFAILVTLNACSAPIYMGTAESTGETSTVRTGDEQSAADQSLGAKVPLHLENFYTLTDPNEAACAGDTRVYFDPLALSSGQPQSFAEDTSLSGETVKPSFVRNISVDLTDSNSPLAGNRAFQCALPAQMNPTSSCATFDAGSIGGTPTSLGGSLLVVGGIQGSNYSGLFTSTTNEMTSHLNGGDARGIAASCGPAIEPDLIGTSGVGATSCATSVYTLSVDSIPSSAVSSSLQSLVRGLTVASEPISRWGSLMNDPQAAVPPGVSGASMAYNAGRNEVLLFGGSSPVIATDPLGPASDTAYTWTYDIAAQTWVKQSPGLSASTRISTFPDLTPGNGTIRSTRGLFGKVLFGYTAAPWTGLQRLSQLTASDNIANLGNYLDNTDRIVTVGGFALNNEHKNTRSFNPTFGPEYVDILSAFRTNNVLLTSNTPGNRGSDPVQWIDSSPSRLLNNAFAATGGTDNYVSQFLPEYFTASGGRYAEEDGTFAFGFQALSLLGTGTTGEKFSTLILSPGFDFNQSSIAAGVQNNGLFYYARKPIGDESFELTQLHLSQLSTAANDPNGYRLNPIDWQSLASDGLVGSPTIAWRGGASFVPGLDLSRHDFVYFGGATCINYLTETSATACTFGNAGNYIRFPVGVPRPITKTVGADSATALSVLDAATNTIVPINAPENAGMAATRGRNLTDGTPIVVAWGGIDSPAAATDGDIYILHNSGAPAWTTATVAGATPPVLANSAMVYSHVTGKFYVYGGYSPASGGKTYSATWELTITSSAGVFTGTWRELAPTCSLENETYCPPARRSHRMVEVNYNNLATADFEPVCNIASAPCSFGIFMEGGTRNGFDLYADRWMFDPTANGGEGHWARVDEFPQRQLASMTSISYTTETEGRLDRAILFGGQTGLQNATMGQDGDYFVAPTLGDTWVYDFQKKTWNRVELLGKGYVDTDLPATLLTERERREAFLIDPAGPKHLRVSVLPQDGTAITPDTDDDDYTAGDQSYIWEMAPPPLSGATLVTRTYPQALSTATGVVAPLKIPEIFLFGGRKKDGTVLPFDHVYKFCLGTTGEKPSLPALGTDDASCDAFDATTNPNSPMTGEYVGRWIRKIPKTEATAIAPYTLDPEDTNAFAAAGAYDPLIDRIILFGGLSSTTAITDASTRTASNAIYEYTPPSKVAGTAAEYNGAWKKIPACTYTDSSVTDGAPVGRYGHNLAYDTIQHRILSVGGFAVDGSPLTTEITDSKGNTFSVPEVWSAKRVTHSGLVDALDPAEVATDSNFPCYHWRKKTTYGNTQRIKANKSPTTGLGHAAAIYIPPSGYNTGYYSMFDSACGSAGPYGLPGSAESRKYAGGVYIDLDRSHLNADENLLLNLTYLPLNGQNRHPDGKLISPNEQSIFNIHLVKTGKTENQLQSIFQPRHLAAANTDEYQRVAQTLSVLSNPFGGVQQEQVLLPITMDAAIDRIHIQRVTGSAILIDVSVIRMAPD